MNSPGDPINALLAQQAQSTTAPAVPVDPVNALLAQQASNPAPMPTAPPAPPQPKSVSMIADMLHAVPGGLAKGVAGIGGLSGDFKSLLDAGMNKLTGANVSTVDASTPTSGQINSAISDPFGGYYKPQTVPGQYAETAASFLPNAIAPGTIAQKLARVLIPAGTSETAGQLTKGTAVEPMARALGAVAGGIGQGAGEGALYQAQNPAPSLEDLSKAKTAAYKAADDAGVVISPQSFQKFATDAGAQLTGNNVVQADIHPNALAALNVLQEEAASGAPVSLSRADAIRQAISGAAEKAAGPNGSNSDLRLVGKVKGLLDDYLDNLGPTDTVTGDASTAVPILKNARDLAQREFKGQQIQKLIDLATNSASTNYSASGYEQALRAQFKNFNAKLINDPNLAKTFSDPERQAISNVAQGGPIGNSLRYLGKFSAHGPMSAMLGMGIGGAIGSHVGGGEGGMAGAVALPAIGEAARSGATAITKRNADLAAQLMRRGTPLPPSQTSAAKTGLASLLLSKAAGQ